jgi:CRP/FNR family transcriptional regulator, dissimilatory nitrate respiration regulator
MFKKLIKIELVQLKQQFSDLAKLPHVLEVSAVHERYCAGQTLFAIGNQPQYIFYVLKGEVLLKRISLGGNEIILHRSSHGFIAEASLRSATYHCDAAAGVATHVLRFPISTVQTSIDSDVGFRTWWMDKLAQQLRTTRSQCERLALKSAADRVLHYVNSESQTGGLTLRQTRKAWAAELGISHETLYRTLAQLQNQGIIHVSNNEQGFDVQLVVM